MYSHYTKVGNIFAGEFDWLWVPGYVRTNTIGVVATHGASVPTHFCSSAWPEANKIVCNLANNGIPVIAGHMGGDQWASDTHLSRIDAARVNMAARTGCRSDKIHLLGASMGAAGAVRYAINNPSKVASLTLLIPVSNLIRNYRTDTPAGSRASIATAWGLTAPRSVADATTTINSANFGSATLALTSADVGKVINSPNFPYGTTLVSQTGTAGVASAPATATGSGVTLAIMTPLPATGDLKAQAAALATIPTRFYYSTVDPYIVPSDVTDLAAAIGSSAQASIMDTTVGHANGAMVNFDRTAHVTWLESLGS